MHWPRSLALGLAAVLLPLAAGAQERPAPKRIQVADGVYLFVTPPYGDVGLDGNAVAILSPAGVLVFDSNGTPAAAAAVIAGIRALTDQPVRYVVNSHWHWDHWYGTEAYIAAFPSVQVIAQEKSRELMIGPALEFNRPGLETQLPAYVQNLEKKVAAAETATPPPQNLAAMKQLAAEDRFFLDQKTGVHHVFPTVTYANRMDIYLGGRHIELLHYDRAITPGDTFLYLPDDKVLVTGDLLINPITFALDCYPTGWLRTLEKIDTLDAAVIVPGHGEPMHDKALLHAHIDVLKEIYKQGRDAKSRGLDPDQAKAAMLPGLHDLMIPLTHDDPNLNKQFEVYLVDWFLHRVYDELDGPLTDAIAPIPKG